MSARVPGVLRTAEADEHSAMRREESDWMLEAIVGAIAAGKLPPDDARAWAMIAASEVEMHGLAPSASLPPQP
jgi:hypothetical protein